MKSTIILQLAVRARLFALGLSSHRQSPNWHRCNFINEIDSIEIFLQFIDFAWKSFRRVLLAMWIVQRLLRYWLLTLLTLWYTDYVECYVAELFAVSYLSATWKGTSTCCNLFLSKCILSLMSLLKFLTTEFSVKSNSSVSKRGSDTKFYNKSHWFGQQQIILMIDCDTYCNVLIWNNSIKSSNCLEILVCIRFLQYEHRTRS